jgi:glyoxylase-like metal-dependent hydrolase (beta-lactamase superfamily II)
MAEQFVRSIQVGAAAITLINVGDIRFDLSQVMKMDRDTPGYKHIFGTPQRVPIQCMLVQLGSTTVLVDAGFYEIAPDSPYALPGYASPPGLNARLAEIGVSRESIDAVVVTHLHFDHYSGLTEERDGAHVPCIERSGMLETVEGNRKLADGVEIIHAPGETPGHQIVRVHSDGQTFYSLGDLYHHPVEIERPEWGSGGQTRRPLKPAAARWSGRRCEKTLSSPRRTSAPSGACAVPKRA